MMARAAPRAFACTIAPMPIGPEPWMTTVSPGSGALSLRRPLMVVWLPMTDISARSVLMSSGTRMIAGFGSSSRYWPKPPRSIVPEEGSTCELP